MEIGAINHQDAKVNNCSFLKIIFQDLKFYLEKNVLLILKVNRVEYRKYEKEKAVIWENKVRKPKNRLKIKNEKFYIIVD